jgi:uncharacterized low-complexity protein
MSKQSKLKPVAFAVGAAFATGMLMSSAGQAAENPFAMNQLDAGYKLAANNEGSCGANKAKAKEASCGANKAEKEKPKLKEGKCGEGKCGSNKGK